MINAMPLDELHAIIDNAQMSNRSVEFDVALVSLSGERPKVFNVEEVYVDVHEGIISLVFNDDQPVNGKNKDREDVNV